ncbi:MAG: ATP-binding protein [Solirubrobacterales bacterium]
MTAVTTSVVFTDLVGSTELASRLGPVGTEEVRSIHFGLLRDAVATTGGSEVKNLGDGLMVVYPSLSAALDGAVAMQQNIELHNRWAPVPLGVRIGVSSGDAYEEEGDYFGEPVVEAARLCARATGGQIVTTEMVHLLARHTDHRFAALGSVELKGLPEPVEAFELTWAPSKASALVPLPSRLEVAAVTGVVGRALERDRLLTTLKAACSRDGHRVALLSGDAGSGKTTLAGDIAQRAHDGGATVLYGRCDEGLGVPYQPFVEALGGFVANAPDSALLAFDERYLSELSRLLPSISARIAGLPEPPETDADAERYLLFGAITSVLAGLAEMAPVVLVIDDLHWADKPTVLLLRHLVATLDQAEVLVVGTYRDSDLAAGHPLIEGLAGLRRESHVERIAIAGLDDNGVLELLESLAGHELGGDGIELAHALRRETGGNPFFTAEVLRHLVETDAIRQEDGRWVGAVELSQIGLPESVREVVGQRVRRLGGDVQQVLALASVIGRDFDLGLLARIAERDEDAVLDALEEAAATQIVAEVDGRSERFTFTHALFQHTLYEELSASRRARIHRRIGELLEAECGDDPGDRIGELAHHWIAATTPAEAGKAAGYARRAGERALGALAPDEAIRWFRQAAELLDAERPGDPLPRLDVLIGLGDAQRQAGDPGHRETLLAAAAEATRLGDPDRLVAAALANHRGMVSSIGAVDAERIAMLELALAAVDDGDSQARARLLAARAAELPFRRDLPRVRALAADAESMARRLGDDATLLGVLNLTFLPLWVPDGLARTVAASQEALTLAGRVGDPVARFWAAQRRVSAMASSADRGGIDAALELAVSLAQEIGQPFLTEWVRQVRCPHVLLTGDADEAERLATEALQIGSDSGQPDALALFGANLAGIRWHQGRLDEILPLIAQAAADNPGLPAFQAAHAMMLCECGRADEARPLLEAARDADFHHAAYDYVWLTTTTVWADTVAWLGDISASGILYERLSPFEAQGVTSGSTFNGTVGMYLARLATVLGRHDDAAGLFERADAALRALRAPFWQARNQVEWARLLRTRGTDTDLRRARELLAEATTTAATYGCGAVERRANELTRALP